MTISFLLSLKDFSVPRLHRYRKAELWALALLLPLLSCQSPEPPPTRHLELSSEAEEILPDETHLYDLPLDAGASIRMVADLRLGDVAMRVESPDGAVLDHSDSGPGISEVVSIVAARTEIYRLVITGRGEDESTPAKYRLVVDAQRPSDPLNRLRVEADRNFRQGYHRASVGRSSENLRAALDAYGKARDLWQQVEDPYEQAITHNRLGQLHDALGEFDAARLAFDASLDHWLLCRTPSGEPTDLELATLRNRANLERDQGRLEEAEDFYLRLLEPLRARLERRWSAPDARRLAQHLRAWAVLLRRQGRLEKAKEVLRESLDLAMAAGSSWLDIARTLTELGTTHRVTGNTGRARETYKRARGLAASTDSEDAALLLAAVDNNLGVVDLLEGRFEEAAVSFERVFQFNKERGNWRKVAQVLLNLAAAESRAGRHQRTKNYFEEALGLFQQQGDRVGEVATAVSLAWLEIDRGEPEEIVAAVTRLEGLLTSSDDTLPIAATATIRGALGFAFLEQQLFEKAAEQLELAVVLDQQGDRVRAAQNRVLLGEALFHAGHLTAAQTLLSGSRADEEYAALPASDASRLHLLALLARHRDQLTTSRQFFERALARVEGLRGQLPGTELRATFFARRRRVYEDYVEMLLLGDHPEAAFAVSERAHARSLFELLHERALDVRADLPADARGHLADMHRRRRVLQSQLWGEDAERAAGGIASDVLRDRLQRLEEERDDFEAELRLQYPDYRALATPTPPALTALAANLPPNTALLEYLIGEEHGWLFVVRGSTIDVFPLEVKGLAALVDTFSATLTDRLTTDPSTFATAAQALYARLLAPASFILEESPRLIIVPDGVLHHLPFEALIDSRAAAANSWSALRYLVRDKALSYAPSASVIHTLGLGSIAETSREQRFVAFGPPRELPLGLPKLPGANKEVEDLATLHTAQGFEISLYREDRATEARFKETDLVHPGDRLHIASHALLNGPKHETRPRLVLGEGAKEDGILELYELWNLDLPADLVVLAACDTHAGEAILGEGLMGLSRGFLGAGARRVLASMVRVHDRATGQLMVSFYGALAEASTAEALRTAKLDLIENDYAHPYYWAPFLLIGDPR